MPGSTVTTTPGSSMRVKPQMGVAFRAFALAALHATHHAAHVVNLQSE